MAQHFETEEKASGDLPKAKGWGQFLHDPRAHDQIGPYGTSAGLIVRALAGRGAAALGPTSLLIERWWADWKVGKVDERRLFCQTPRLAFIYLALSASKVLENIRAEIKAELFKRLLPSAMWGNYWTSDTVRDETPRLFSTSIVVLCLVLCEEAPETLVPQLSATVEAIETTLLGDASLPLLHTAMGTAAILSIRKSTKGKFRSYLRRIGWSSRASLADLGVYFYDFQYVSEKGAKEFGRDYFIVPVEFVVGLAGFTAGAPGALRNRGEKAVKELTQNLNDHDGLYKSDPEQRVSCKNQAWAALLLTRSVPVVPNGFMSRLWWELLREREANWFTEIAFPVVSLFAMSLEVVIFHDLGPFVSVIVGLGTLIISALYGGLFIRKWFPGR